MNRYAQGILDRYRHANSKKHHISPHRHTYISYVSTVQYAVEADSRPPIDALGIKRVQVIVGNLLYYLQSVKNKILVALRSIVSQKASATKRTSADITQLIN